MTYFGSLSEPILFFIFRRMQQRSQHLQVMVQVTLLIFTEEPDGGHECFKVACGPDKPHMCPCHWSVCCQHPLSLHEEKKNKRKKRLITLFSLSYVYTNIDCRECVRVWLTGGIWEGKLGERDTAVTRDERLWITKTHTSNSSDTHGCTRGSMWCSYHHGGTGRNLFPDFTFMFMNWKKIKKKHLRLRVCFFFFWVP